MMSNNRGKRGRPKKFAVKLVISDEAQLQRTLDLSNISGDKPHINDIIEEIVDRMEREEAAKSLALAKKWRNSRVRNMYGWPSDMMDYLCMGGDYEGYDDYLNEAYDEYEIMGSHKLKSLKKKKKHHSRYDDDEDDFWKHRSSMFRNGEWDDSDLDDEDNHEECYKSIKFYSDIENELSVREFDSLKSFNDFCADNGYIISTIDYNNLLNESVIHCCLDPISLEYGDKEIITDNSYGALYWTVSEDMTKCNELEHKSTGSGLEARTLTD